MEDFFSSLGSLFSPEAAYGAPAPPVTPPVAPLAAPPVAPPNGIPGFEGNTLGVSDFPSIGAALEPSGYGGGAAESASGLVGAPPGMGDIPGAAPGAESPQAAAQRALAGSTLANALKGAVAPQVPRPQVVHTPQLPRPSGAIKQGELLQLLGSLGLAGGAEASPYKLPSTLNAALSGGRV